MIRLRVLLGTVSVLSALVASFVSAQLAGGEKKTGDPRGQVREEAHSIVSPTPTVTPKPRPKPAKRKAKSTKKPASKRKATPTPAAKKSPTPEAEESPAPASRSNAKSGSRKSEDENEDKDKDDKTPEPTLKPGAKKSPTPEADESPASKSKTKSGSRKSEDENEIPKPKPGGKTGAKKTSTATPEPEESPASKSKAKSGSKKSKEAEETPMPEKKAKSGTVKSENEDEDEIPMAKPAGKTGAKKTPTATPVPEESPASKSKAKSGSKKSKEAEEIPSPDKKAKSETKKSEDEDEDGTQEAKPARTPVPIEKPVKVVPEHTPQPAPRPRPVSPRPLPQTVLPPDITVEKSGLERDQGLEPPPPPPTRRGFWGWSRKPVNYQYLTSATIEAIRRAPVQRGRWKFAIVHNSGTRQGSARVFDYYHRKIRRMRNGLAYHFVIGNGTSTRDGQIEIGDRWRLQKSGGHVHSDYMNNIGLGICLVGDFNRDQPTRAQLEATDELIRYLQERCGKSDGRSLVVRPHREVNPPRWSTDCPGDAFPYGWFGKFR